MPFVRTIKKYYEDVTTTKYWKEITTGSKELEFACYHELEGFKTYYYAKAPIGEDLKAYHVLNDVTSAATSSSQLYSQNDYKFKSLTESEAYLGSTHLPRYPEGDLYIDSTTTTVVEGTPEDYTYTEEVTETFEVSADDDWTRVEVVKNEYYQLAKPKRFFYKYSNETDVKIVGNRSIIKNGVASDFKAASYLLLPDTFDVAGGKTWEIVVCVETGSDVTSEQSITGTDYYRYDPITLTVKSSRFYMNLCSGTSTTLIEAAKGTYAVQPNTRYWLKATFDGANYTLDYSLDGVDFVNDITKASTKYIHSKPLILGCQAASENGTVKVPWLGSVDLNETYVNINGERWWDISKGYTPTGYWINEGIASGWGGSIYLTAPYNIDIASGKEWEIVFKFKTGTNITTNQTVFSIPNWSLAFNIENSKTSFYLSSNGTSWNMASALLGTTTLETETWYYGKMSFNGNKYVLALSKDGIDWTEESVLESTTPINNASKVFTIGRYTSSIAFANTGLIDLNECYVKINNRLWWHGTKVIEGDKDNYAFYEDRLLSYAPILKSGKQYTPLFESAVGGTYEVTIPEDTNVRVTMVGGGGAAAIRGVYDDKGYGWSGGSGGAFIGTFALPKGTYSVTVGSANNNTKGQGGNSATLNPTDLTTHDSYIDGVVRVGGGGYGYYNPSAAGAAGAAATFDIEPLSITMNKTGNAGTSGSGGKGSAAAKTVSGGASVWGGYGTGQGCKTSEYASKRSWINGTGGYVRIEMWTQTGEQLY